MVLSELEKSVVKFILIDSIKLMKIRTYHRVMNVSQVYALTGDKSDNIKEITFFLSRRSYQTHKNGRNYNNTGRLQRQSIKLTTLNLIESSERNLAKELCKGTKETRFVNPLTILAMLRRGCINVLVYAT